LGFGAVFENSIDAVSDRDFALEFVSASLSTALHVSRLAEDLVLWSSAEFGFVRPDDAYATGSSIMPQKRNPDAAELARAQTGRVAGAGSGARPRRGGDPHSGSRRPPSRRDGGRSRARVDRPSDRDPSRTTRCSSLTRRSVLDRRRGSCQARRSPIEGGIHAL